jgi:hypothetical protein
MVEAGLIEPLPNMFVGIGYLAIIIMSIAFVVNLVKWIVGEVRAAVIDDSLMVKPG